MFTNCRHCNALVATDPATDEPPERCPRCAGTLRAPAATGMERTPMDSPPAGSVDAGEVGAPTATADAPPSGNTSGQDDTAPAQAPPADPVQDTAPAPANADAMPAGADVPGEGTVPAPAPPPRATPRKPEPSFVAPRRARPSVPSRNRWGIPAAIGALSLLLALQVVLADRERLAMEAGWRPLLATLCGAFGCDLPAWREPAAFTLLGREVRPHPSRPGVLRATATFRNDARWPQAWPTLVLTLSDVDGRVAGTRAFAAHEYLGATPADATLASGQSAMIRLDVVEPAASVVAFSFEFH
jgi:hypothetical protein